MTGRLCDAGEAEAYPFSWMGHDDIQTESRPEGGDGRGGEHFICVWVGVRSGSRFVVSEGEDQDAWSCLVLAKNSAFACVLVDVAFLPPKGAAVVASLVMRASCIRLM